MPAVINLPSAPTTGHSSLGNILLASATDYADKRRADEREARLRAQRLQDVADERNYQQAQVADTRAYEKDRHAALRLEQLADLGLREQMAMKAMLADKGYLAPTDFDKPAAVQFAYERAQRDGLLDRYKDLIGAGLLEPTDVSNPSHVEGAMATAGSLKMAEVERLRELPRQAKDRVDQLAAQRDVVTQRALALEAALSEPEPAPSPRAVADRAYRMAKAMVKPGAEPSQVEIAANLDAAAAAIQQESNAVWARQKQDAAIQRSILQDQLRDITSEINVLGNKFGVTGLAAPTAPAVAAPAAPAGLAVDSAVARQRALQGIIEAVKGARGGAGGSVAPAAASQPVAPVNHFLEDVTPPTPVRGNRGQLLQSIGDVKRARNTDYVMDLGRQIGQGISNLMPAAITKADIGPSGFVTAESSPKVRATRIAQLQSRLAALRQSGTPLEADIRFELEKLQRINDQEAAKRAQLNTLAPVSDASSTNVPGWGSNLQWWSDPIGP